MTGLVRFLTGFIQISFTPYSYSSQALALCRQINFLYLLKWCVFENKNCIGISRVDWICVWTALQIYERQDWGIIKVSRSTSAACLPSQTVSSSDPRVGASLQMLLEENERLCKYFFFTFPAFSSNPSPDERFCWGGPKRSVQLTPGWVWVFRYCMRRTNVSARLNFLGFLCNDCMQKHVPRPCPELPNRQYHISFVLLRVWFLWAEQKLLFGSFGWNQPWLPKHSYWQRFCFELKCSNQAKILFWIGSLDISTAAAPSLLLSCLPHI